MAASKKLTKQRAAAILKKFKSKKILVFGDVGVDRYTMGRVTRISPEAPIPIVEVKETRLKLGLAANVADNVMVLGGAPALVGVIGEDFGSQEFEKLLKEMKISSKFLVRDSSRPTIIKERVVADHQQVVRIDHESSKKMGKNVIESTGSSLEKALAEADCVIIEDYAKGLVDRDLCKNLIQGAKARKIPVLVDPNVRSPLDLYAGCTMLTPNTSEAEALSGIRIDDSASLLRAGKKILKDTKSDHAIITRGKDGMAIFSRGKEKPVLIPTFAREVYDVSGAGDTVIATLALALVSGGSVVEAALLANYAAGIEVGKRGTATVTREEILEFIEFFKV